MLKVEALRYIDVSDVAIVFTTVPIGVMIVSWYLLGEKIHMPQAFSVVLCASGIVIVMRPTFLFPESAAPRDYNRPKGFLYALGSAMALVALVIILRIMAKNTAHFIGFNSGLTRTFLAMVFSILSGNFSEILTGRFLGTLVMTGKINFCAVFFLSKALLKESAATVSTVKFCGDIIFSILVQMVFTREYPDLWSVFGTLLVLGSFVTVAGGKAASWYADNFMKEYRRRAIWVRSFSLYPRPLARQPTPVGWSR